MLVVYTPEVNSSHLKNDGKGRRSCPFGIVNLEGELLTLQGVLTKSNQPVITEQLKKNLLYIGDRSSSDRIS